MRRVDGVGVWVTLCELDTIEQSGGESSSQFTGLEGRVYEGGSIRLDWAELEAFSAELLTCAREWEEQLGDGCDCVACGRIVRGFRSLGVELGRLSREHVGSAPAEAWEH